MILGFLLLLLVPLVFHVIDGQTLLWFNFLLWYAGLILPSFILSSIGISWSTARVLSLLTFSFPLYLLSNFLALPINGIIWLIFCLIGGYLAYSKRRLFDFKSILHTELFFVLVFVLFLTINAFHPALYWGEKPMDISSLGYFLRLDYGPVIDPWAYGTKLQYYALGYFSWSMPAKLSLMGLEQAYVYSIAGVAGMTALAASEFYKSFSKKYHYLYALIFIFVGTLGVLNSFYKGNIFGSLSAFWSATRVFTFNHFAEFPLWSFIFSDLHPHVMAYPILILVFSKIFLSVRAKPDDMTLFSTTLALVLLPWLNAWDFLVMMGLAAILLLSYKKEILNKKFVFSTLLICLSGLFAFSFLSSASRVSTFGFAPSSGLFGLVLHFLIPVTALVIVSLKQKNYRLWIVTAYLIGAIFLVDNIIFMDRVNTVFKFMTTLGVCVSLFIPVVLEHLSGFKRYLSIVIISLMVVCNLTLVPMIISSKPFPVKIPSLNGFSFIKYSLPSDSGLIEFLNQQEGTPLILEYPGNSFDYQASRISAFTGLPLFLGWDNHVVLRGKTWKTILERKNWIDGMYKSTDALMVYKELVERDVRYIVVGPTEYKHYNESGLKKFENYPELFKPVKKHLSSILFEIVKK